MVKRFIVLSCALFVALLYYGCKTQAVDLPDGVVAKLNGKDITVDEYRTFCGGTLPGSPRGRMDELGRLLDKKLVSSLAKKEGFMADPQVGSEVMQQRNGRLAELMRKKVVEEVSLDEDEIPYPEVEPGVVLELFQILTPDAETAQKARAEVMGGAKFDQVASKYSKGISAKGGGYLGEVYLAGSVYSVGVRAILNKLQPGEVSPVVKMDLGYAVFKVKSRKSPEEFAKLMRDRLAGDALKAKREGAVADLIAKLRKENKVEYNERFFEGKDNMGWVVKVNGQELRVDPGSLEAADPFHQPHQRVGVKELRVSADRAVNDMLLGMEAQKRGLHMTSKFLMESTQEENEILADNYIKRRVWPSTPLTEEDYRAYYEKHKAGFTRPKRVKLSRILVFTEGEAEKILDKLRAGEDFSTLAYHKSKDKSAETGGDMGYIYQGSAMEPIESTVFKMKAGEYSGVLKTKYGYEIVKVVEVREGGIVPMEDMRDKLERKVDLERKANSVTAFYKQIREAADIQVNSKLLQKLND